MTSTWSYGVHKSGTIFLVAGQGFHLLLISHRLQSLTITTKAYLASVTPRDPHGHYDLGYSLGFLTVEALSAVWGADSAMNLYKLMPSNSFETAFELTYGTPWNEAKHILASVVSSNALATKASMP